MARADKDGRIARSLSDRMACLSMDMYESIREATEQFGEDFPELVTTPGRTAGGEPA